MPHIGHVRHGAYQKLYQVSLRRLEKHGDMYMKQRRTICMWMMWDPPAVDNHWSKKHGFPHRIYLALCGRRLPSAAVNPSARRLITCTRSPFLYRSGRRRATTQSVFVWPCSACLRKVRHGGEASGGRRLSFTASPSCHLRLLQRPTFGGLHESTALLINHVQHGDYRKLSQASLHPLEKVGGRRFMISYLRGKKMAWTLIVALRIQAELRRDSQLTISVLYRHIAMVSILSFLLLDVRIKSLLCGMTLGVWI